MSNIGKVCSRFLKSGCAFHYSDHILNACQKHVLCRHLHLGLSDADIDSFNNEGNLQVLEESLKQRKFSADIEKIKTLHKQIKSSEGQLNWNEINSLKNDLKRSILQLPNSTHPDVLHLKASKVVKVVNEKPEFSFKPLDLEKLSEMLDCLETGSHIGKLMGPQSYYLKNYLVDLERALISSTVQTLVNEHGFELVSVPDLLNRGVIEACGMDTYGERNQVYKVKKKEGDADVCLSGTAEMALAGMFSDEVIDIADLPMKLASVSRCYRAETSNLKKEKGIFRVHEFTKVEIFSITADESQNESSKMLEEFCSIQTKLSEDLGLHFKVLDMAPFELGKPAYRKYDIEAWMPGRQLFGEISSASNCTDYQSRRLDIKYRNRDGDVKYTHTVNGTACAIPRMLISIFETYQQADKTIKVPSILKKYLKTDVFKSPIKRVYVSRIKS